MPETEILPIGNAELKYFDDFSGPKDLVYEIVKPCSCLVCGKGLNDTGRIIDISKKALQIL